MFGTRGLARILLSGIFLVGGASAWKRASSLAPKAERFSKPIAELTGVRVGGEDLVRFNSGVQVVAGGLLAIGVQQRLMALVLAGSLVPTTVAGHSFWDVDDEADMVQQRIHFLKNAGLIGGLVFAALDTGGRPSIFWTGRRVAADIADSVVTTVTPD